MEKSNAKKEERKIYVEEQQQQPVQSETHNWRVLCMRETKKAIWHILFHSLFVIITFIMRFFFSFGGLLSTTINARWFIYNNLPFVSDRVDVERERTINNTQKSFRSSWKEERQPTKKKLTKMKEKVGLATDWNRKRRRIFATILYTLKQSVAAVKDEIWSMLLTFTHVYLVRYEGTNWGEILWVVWRL